MLTVAHVASAAGHAGEGAVLPSCGGDLGPQGPESGCWAFPSPSPAPEPAG